MYVCVRVRALRWNISANHVAILHRFAILGRGQPAPTHADFGAESNEVTA